MQYAISQEVYPGRATKVEKNISADFSFTPNFLNIGNDTIHYVESGKGDPVLLLHGLPSSSYLWRNVIPNLDDNKKVIALDFLGFGKSSFPKDRDVSIEVQYEMLTDFIEAKNLKNITLVRAGYWCYCWHALCHSRTGKHKGHCPVRVAIYACC